MRIPAGHHRHHHLLRFLGAPSARRDHRAARTLFGLSALSVAVTVLVVGFGGQYASRFVSPDTAARWASGDVFDHAGGDGHRIVMGDAPVGAPPSHTGKKNKSR